MLELICSLSTLDVLIGWAVELSFLKPDRGDCYERSLV